LLWHRREQEAAR